MTDTKMQPIASATQALSRITLVASDMDGTMTSHGRFSTSVFRAFDDLRNSGVRILLITGRSAGWVNGLVSLLPIDGAVAENGGIYFPANEESHGTELIALRGSRKEHKEALRNMFLILQKEFPQISEAPDNTYRLTDWTFSVEGLTDSELTRMKTLCNSHDWDFTYSNVQCHITPRGQDKSQGLLKLISEIPHLKADPTNVLTIGDSPNDESIFDTNKFPCSVGVANIKKYATRLAHLPAYVTTEKEGNGFCEMVAALVASQKNRK